MLLAYVNIIVAAVARFPGVLPLGPLAFFGLAFLFMFAGVNGLLEIIERRRAISNAYNDREIVRRDIA